MKKVAKIEFLFELFRVVLGLLIAYLFTLLAIVFVAEEPLEAVREFALGPFMNARRFGQIMGKFIPYMISGCGMCFIYACGRFNLIGEGIVNFAPCIAAMVLFNTSFMSGLPLIVNLAILLVICAAVGCAVSAVPTFCRENLGGNETVLSIIMNYMLLYLSLYLLKRFLADRAQSYLCSELFPDNARFPALLANSNFHAGIFVSILCVVAACLIFYKMRIGQKIRLSGANVSFARYSGIRSRGAMYAAQLIGGAFMGIAGCVDVFGLYNRYQYSLLTNIGMDGLIVAVIARKKPIFVPFAAFVLAYIRTSAVVLNLATSIPFEFVNMMQAVLILFVAAQGFLEKSKNKIIFKRSREAELCAGKEAN